MNERNELPLEESNEEASMLSQFFGTAQDAVERYTHCVICGANLHFTHITDFSKNLTQESARCLECGVHTKKVTHRLQ